MFAKMIQNMNTKIQVTVWNTLMRAKNAVSNDRGSFLSSLIDQFGWGGVAVIVLVAVGGTVKVFFPDFTNQILGEFQSNFTA